MGLALLGAALLAAAAGRDEAQKVLRSARCDKCHDSALPTAVERALAVFDLHEEAWPRRMTAEQLPKLMGRLRGAPAADRRVVQRFIEAELRSR